LAKSINVKAAVETYFAPIFEQHCVELLKNIVQKFDLVFTS